MSRLPTPVEASRWWPDDTSGSTLRARLTLADAELARAFQAGAEVETLVRARAWVIEQAVLSGWRSVAAQRPEFALVAAGGFGRGELHPRSDVDLMVLTLLPATPADGELLERFFAELWDQGLAVGHAVRTPEQCREAAVADVTIATSLLDARLIAGPTTLFVAMQSATSPPGAWPSARFTAAKLAEQHTRHARFNDTAYNLEPNLKDGPGGLRDLQTVQWLAHRQLGLTTLEALRDSGLLAAEEYDPICAARRTLWRIRFALHLLAKRPEERLLFEHQRELARQFGYADEHAQNLAVEQFMQAYYRAAMTVERFNERLLQRLDEARVEAAGEADSRLLDSEFCSVAGFLDLRDPSLFERAPAAIMRAFRRLLDHPEIHGFRSTLLKRLDSVLPGLDEGFRSDPAVNAAFMDILRHPGPVPDVLQRMSRYGVLGRYLPAFGRVAGRMQYDLFHVYTVDQHTLFVLRNIRRFAEADAATTFPLAHELYLRVRKPELLLLAGLFHDIAKGRGGDHSELGEVDARAFCAQAGLPSTDTDLVAWLVRQHLIMSITAQKQDINDPDVVRRFATIVAERDRLDYLYLLTVADICGTSPKLWNSWKDRLLADLHRATRNAMRRGLEHEVQVSERVAETQQQALQLLRDRGWRESAVEALWRDFPQDSFLRYGADQIAWQTRTILEADPERLPLVAVRSVPQRGTSEVFVYSPDRDGLFATITAALDRLQLNVVEARIVNSRRRVALDTFHVLEQDGQPVHDATRIGAIEDKLEIELSRPTLALKPSRRAATRQQRQFHVPTQIEFDATPAGERTVLSLVCADRPGLLAHIAQAFRECAVRVHDARIATFGERAEDLFQLSDEHDQALSTAQQEALRAAILRQMDESASSTPTAAHHVHA